MQECGQGIRSIAKCINITGRDNGELCGRKAVYR
jgi:hypothetical protein